MKKVGFIAIIIVVLFCFFSSCRKDGDGVLSQSYFCAELNGKKWTGKVGFSEDKNNENAMTISVERQKSKSISEFLYFGNVPMYKGMFALKNVRINATTFNIAGTAFDTSVGGDVACDSYQIDSTEALLNFIDIQEVNPKKHTIKGAFMGTYIRIGGICEPSAPDTLKFREGTFFIKYK